MPDEPPSILPRGTGTRRPLSPSPALPGSAVYIQSVAGLSCIAAGAIGSAETSGGRSPASISATRQLGSSDSREAITAPAEAPNYDKIVLVRHDPSPCLISPGRLFAA